MCCARVRTRSRFEGTPKADFTRYDRIVEACQASGRKVSLMQLRERLPRSVAQNTRVAQIVGKSSVIRNLTCYLTRSIAFTNPAEDNLVSSRCALPDASGC